MVIIIIIMQKYYTLSYKVLVLCSNIKKINEIEYKVRHRESSVIIHQRMKNGHYEHIQ